MADREQAAGVPTAAAPRGGVSDRAPGQTEPERWSFEGFVVDLAAHVLRDPAGRDVPLRRSEFALLTAFLRAPGRALSRDYLLDAVAGRRAEAFDRSIDVMVGRLRKHIEPDPKVPRLIVTVAGIGYKFVARPRPGPAAEEGDSPPIAATAPPARPAERRLLTIMRCGIVGAGSTAASLDPEDWREAVAGFRACSAEVIGRFGGFVAASADHSVVAWFGYPEANELDAERAIYAALALVAAVPAIPHGVGGPLHAHLGIASGLVLVSDAEPGASGRAALGEAPSLAGALLSLAAADSVLIAARTRELVGELFALRALGPLSAAGFAQPVEAWAVTGPGAAEGRFAALRARNLSPLVGREEELALLLRRWEQAKAGSGRVVLISAEPGLGKSRLTEALAERIAAERHVRLRYFCSPHHQDSAFYPIIAQMERAAGFARDDSPETKIAKLRQLLVDSTPPEELALIADLHALPSASIAPPLDVTPQKKREKTFAALLAQAERLLRQQPMLMVFEDLHWIDPSSRELLDRIIQRAANWPAVLLATFRPEFQPPWTGQPNVTALTLSRLDRDATSAMVRNIAAGSLLSRDIAEEIAKRADGVPLFVEELTRAVVESDVQLAAAVSATARPAPTIPTTLHASLAARLDALGGAAKDIAQKCAAIGREFNYQLLAAIADLPEPTLRDGLEKLRSSGLLFVRGDPPDSTYTFKHALVQDAAYGALPRSRRQQVHGRIVAILEEQFADVVSVHPTLLAQHCTEAGLAEKAVAYWLRAGGDAVARSAMVEAVAQLRKGLEALADMPDGRSRQQHELDLHIALGPALAATKGFSAADVGKTIARARMLAEQTGRPEDLVPLIYGQFGFHLIRSEHKLALPLAKQIKAIGEARHEIPTQLLGRRVHARTCVYLGEFTTARTLFEQGIALPVRNIVAPVQDYAAMLASLAETLAYLGYIDQARSRLEAAISEARRLGHAFTLAHVLVLANWTVSIISSPNLQPSAEELLTLATEYAFDLYSAYAIAFRGRSLTALGHAQEGLTLLTQALVAVRATGAVLRTPTLLVWLAHAHALLGQLGEGLNCLAEAEQIIESTDERVNEAELHRVGGELLNATSNPSVAEPSFRHALIVAERQHAKLFELRASIGLARLWRDQGRREDARNLLAPVYAWFTEGFDAPDLVEAKAVLDELAGQ